MACKAFGAVALWLEGHPDTAARVRAEAVRLSHRLGQPSSQALALHFAAMLHQLRRDGPGVRALPRLRRLRLPARPLVLDGGECRDERLALAECGAPSEGIGRLRGGPLDWQATGSKTYKTYYLGLLAEVLTGRGQFDEVARVLEEARQWPGRHRKGCTRPNCIVSGVNSRSAWGARRISPVPNAEADFRLAVDLARRQKARSLELRAAPSLTRLGQRLGKVVEARRHLVETYDSFTEGFDTPDLREL